jgi:hypothetical protein
MCSDRVVDVLRNKADPHVGNRGLSIVFIPWPWDEAQEFIKKTEQWNHVTGCKYRIVHFKTGQKDPFIQQANNDSSAQIYVRGHGAVGRPEIQIKVDTGGTAVDERKIPIVWACDRLMSMGLTKKFSGAIKFFSCYSGTKFADDAFAGVLDHNRSRNEFSQQALDGGVIDAAAFAKRYIATYPNRSIAGYAADYMRANGFKQCNFYGYLGPLESEYADDGNGDWHKAVNLTGLRNSPGGMVGTHRASAGRIQV